MNKPRLLDLYCCANFQHNKSSGIISAGGLLMTTTITCHHCGKVFESQRSTRKFCSRACANRSAWAKEKIRNCSYCGKPFALKSAADANRQHCSKECAKNHNRKRIKTWQEERPGIMKKYNANRVAKNPGVYQQQKRQERLEMIALLGGKCIVCGVDNPYWLHIDYIPTTRNEQYRHPRHLKYVREHLDKFRLLCANHHYELTLTGHIEGTDIWQ